VFVSRQVNDFNLFLSAVIDSARVRNDLYIGVELRFPVKVEAELSIVEDGNLASLALVDEEIAELDREGNGFFKLSRRADFYSGLASEDFVVNLVTFSLNVEN